MDIWNKIKSGLGLTTDENNIDKNGVDHSNMSIRDELDYQLKNVNKKTKENFFDNFTDNYANITRKFGVDKLIKNIYNLAYDGGERIASSQKSAENFENRSSVGIAQSEAQRLNPVGISDVQKHRYVSCVGSFDGPVSAAITGAAGLYKEGSDLKRKWNNSKYGSNMDIIADSVKDLKNDAIGIVRGLISEKITDCDDYLPVNVRHRK